MYLFDGRAIRATSIATVIYMQYLRQYIDRNQTTPSPFDSANVKQLPEQVLMDLTPTIS